MTRDEYVREVELALRDLPWSQRRDLVAELREHLAELPSEADFAERLGSPEKYAADLRAAAGLERRHGFAAFIRARRPRNVVIAVVAIVLVLTATGLGIAAVVWVDRYQPLVNVGADLEPGPSTPTPGQDGITVDFHAGRPFGYGVAVGNYGRYTVRILGIPPQSRIYSAWTGRLMMAKSETDWNSLEPFHPFDLKPHSFRLLAFKGVYKCGPVKWGGQNPSFGLTDFPVRFSFLWRTATVPIPLMSPITISFRKEACK